MLFNYKYAGNTTVRHDSKGSEMSFVPDALRTPTYFRGALGKALSFREAISALHHVVVSDLRWKPKDREAYKAWAAEQEQRYLEEMLTQKATVREQIGVLRAELGHLNKEAEQIMGPFYRAQRKYFDYIYKKDRDAWFVLDPVITVHPDELFFECFSQDESTYGRLGCSYEVFKQIDTFECGTTNIDYSQALYQQFQKIRTYKDTQFTVDPSGFEVQTQQEDLYKELKIDLPDSWVRGFLQVSSAMTLDQVELELHPMDVHNLCFILRRYKEKKGPRSIRFKLHPGQPIRLVFEPWDFELVCPRSIYLGAEEKEIRIWGRRRLLILERLIPVTQKFRVKLLGTGLPSFFIADLGHMNFTLGLSGWTKNDWSRAGNFDLLAPRGNVDLYTKSQVFNALKERWVASVEVLSQDTGLTANIIQSALGTYIQAGKVIYDLNKMVYRYRPLSREPLPLDQLRFSNEREAEAYELIKQNQVRVLPAVVASNGTTMITGEVSTREGIFPTELEIDADERLVNAKCTCRFFKKNKLYQGPCKHILATRILYNQKRQN